MHITKKASMVIALTGILIAVIAFGNEASSQETRRRHHGPPPEAYTACEGKNAGGTAEFVTPHGDTVTGTCEQHGDRLFLRPDKPHREDSDEIWSTASQCLRGDLAGRLEGGLHPLRQRQSRTA